VPERATISKSERRRGDECEGWWAGGTNVVGSKKRAIQAAVGVIAKRDHAVRRRAIGGEGDTEGTHADN